LFWGETNGTIKLSLSVWEGNFKIGGISSLKGPELNANSSTRDGATLVGHVACQVRAKIYAKYT